MKPKIKLILILIMVTAVSLACGLLDIGLEQADQNNPARNDSTQGSTTGESLPPTEPTAHPNTQYWKLVEDTRYGVKMAVPCFWSADLLTPDQDPSGMGSFPVQNFDQAYISRLNAKNGDLVWRYGGTKMDIVYFQPSTWNLPETASLEDLALAIFDNDGTDPDTYLDKTETVTFNGQEGLKVVTQSTTWGEGVSYLFSLRPNLVLSLNPGPFADSHPDILPILNSLSLSPDVEVNLPIVKPAEPPIGMGAACLGIAEGEIPTLQPSPSTGPITGTLECSQVTPEDKLMWVACNVQDSIRSRNTQPLPGYMGQEFMVGYWRSEGVIVTPATATQYIIDWTPPDPSIMTFTTDESLFPSLLGMSPEQIVNPEINIVEVIYSEGWNQDGQGAAFLYLAENQAGEYYFYGMLVGQFEE
jgi:hypothetical protein